MVNPVKDRSKNLPTAPPHSPTSGSAVKEGFAQINGGYRGFSPLKYALAKDDLFAQ